jgi:hypothetical protein
VLAVLGVGCTPPSKSEVVPVATSFPVFVDAGAPAVPPVVTADASAPIPAVASWQLGDDAGSAWVRSPGRHAPPLVLRGTLRPVQPHDLAVCDGWQGARLGAAPVSLDVEGPARPLVVWARAIGPIGIRAGAGGADAYARDVGASSCAVAGPGAWARLDLDDVAGPVAIDVADVDFRGQRRGQTSPYVLVVTDDATTPTEAPGPRAPLDPHDVTVRWDLKPASCPSGEEEWHCSKATLVLGGAVQRRVPLKPLLRGQSGCWPDGTGAFCAGASGASTVTLKTSATGVVDVSESSVSDGDCPPEMDGGCASTTPWARFTVPTGVRLVPEPEGTFPPAE